jgi:hypothetical protein
VFAVENIKHFSKIFWVCTLLLLLQLPLSCQMRPLMLVSVSVHTFLPYLHAFIPAWSPFEQTLHHKCICKPAINRGWHARMQQSKGTDGSSATDASANGLAEHMRQEGSMGC